MAVQLKQREELYRKAQKLRREVVQMVAAAESGHPGGALGVADLMTVLYYRYFRDRPDQPGWEGRDRFVLSNGHICPILYTILADRGYFPSDLLPTFRELGSPLQGHPSVVKGLPGIEYSGGSLGNGLSYAVGLALAEQLKPEDYRIYCMISDGECQEGQVWEAAMSAAHYDLDRLTVLLDFNGTQIDGATRDIMDVGRLAQKWAAFGWQVSEIDAHDYDQIIEAFEQARAETERPSIIVANTVIGKGVSYMEGDYHWHHGAPDEEQLAQALRELGGESE